MASFGELKATVPYPGPNGPSAVALQPGGDVIVTVASHGRLWGYDFGTARQLWAPIVEVGSIASQPVFNPDGSAVAVSWLSAAFTDSRVRIVDAVDGHDRAVLTAVVPEGFLISAPVFSPDGTVLACHTFDPGRLAVFGTASLGAEDAPPWRLDQALEKEAGRQDGKPIAAFSADSSILAYYCEIVQAEPERVLDRFVKAVDVVNHRETAVRATTTAVTNWVLTPDGRRIVTVQWGPARTFFYDVETGARTPGFPLTGVAGPGTVAFSPDRRYLAVATRAGLWMYHLDDGEPVPLINALYVEPDAAPTKLVLSPGGRYVATFTTLPSGASKLRITDTKTNSVVLRPDRGWAAGFSPDGRYVAVGGAGQSIEIRHVGDPPSPSGGALFPGRVRCRLDVQDDVTAVGLAGGDPPSVVVATTAERDTVTMLAAADAHQLLTFTVPGSVVAVAGGDDGAFGAVGGTDGVLRVRRNDGGPDWSSRARGPINAVAVANGVVASASSDGFVRVYTAAAAAGEDLANRRPARQIGNPDHPRGMLHVAVSADGRYVAAGCSDGRVYVSDWRTGAPPVSFGQNGNRVNCVRFGTGHTVAAGFDWTSAIVFDADTGSTSEYDVRGRVSAVALDADASLLATVVADEVNSLAVWSLAAGPGVDPLLQTRYADGPVSGIPGGIADVAFSPINPVLAVALEVGRVEIRAIERLDRVLTVLPFEGPVRSIEFSADGTLFVASSDRAVRVYDAV